MNSARQVLRDIQVAFDERLVDDHLGGDVAEFRLPPGLHLLAHRLEVPLHPVHADSDRIHQRKSLLMLGEEWLKDAWDKGLRVPAADIRIPPQRRERFRQLVDFLDLVRLPLGRG